MGAGMSRKLRQPIRCRSFGPHLASRKVRVKNGKLELCGRVKRQNCSIAEDDWNAVWKECASQWREFFVCENTAVRLGLMW